MLIEIENLNKYYLKGKQNEVHALKDLSLKVDSGDLICITGPSGSGKSTLLHIISGIDSFNSGTYYFDGTDMEKASDKVKSKLRNSEIGIIMQDFGLIGDQTVIKNVLLPMEIANMKKSRSTEKALSALRKVNIDDLAYKQVNQLSGGQKQRVAIARALGMNSKVILADEPTGALDSETTSDLLNLIKNLNDDGITFIIVTHNPVVAACGKRHIQIVDGIMKELQCK